MSSWTSITSRPGIRTVSLRASRPITLPKPRPMKPYFSFFSRRPGVGLDLLLSGPELPPGLAEAVKGSLLLAARGEQ